MAKPRKLDIQALCHATDRHDFNWLTRQPEDVRKEFLPVVAIRWAVTFKDDSQHVARMLWLINDRVNRYLYQLTKHPDLLYRLLASCGTGRTSRRDWLAAPRQHRDANKVITLLREQNPMANNHEIDLLLAQFTRPSFAALLDDCGKQPDEAREYMKAYDALPQTNGR